MPTIYLDIETIPTTDPELVEFLCAKVAPPKNYKKPEAIAKWWEEEGVAAREEAVGKTAFDGTYGRVICAAYAVDDAPAVSHDVDSEQSVLTLLMTAFASASSLTYHGGRGESGAVWVGHNLQFDLRFLWQRCVIHGVKMPGVFIKAVRAKPWDANLADTMLLWHPERDRKISLDALCRALGVSTSKGDLDGSKVFQAWKDGRISDIAAYCRADVEATRQCYHRMLA